MPSCYQLSTRKLWETNNLMLLHFGFCFEMSKVPPLIISVDLKVEKQLLWLKQLNKVFDFMASCYLKFQIK